MKNCVVVLNYNDSKRTVKFLDDIKEYRIIDEIIVVDNNSTDNSYEVLKKYKSKKVTILKNKINKGYGSGNNYGCRYAIDKYTNPIIFISNPDVIVNEKTFIELINTLKESKDVAIAAPKIYQDGGYEKGWKLVSSFKGALIYLPLVYRIMKNKQNNIYFYPGTHYINKKSYVDVVTGCFFAIKGEILKEIDYFDENIFLYNEEEVIARKLKNAGYKTVLMNNLEVIHEHSISINKTFSNIRKIKLANKSKIYYQKVYNKANILELFIWYFVNDLFILKNIIMIVINKLIGGKK